jgi:hypothetical protein
MNGPIIARERRQTTCLNPHAVAGFVLISVHTTPLSTISMQVQLEFRQVAVSTLDLLFDQQTSISVTLPSTDRGFSMRELLPWMRDNLLRERPELFMQGDSV